MKLAIIIPARYESSRFPGKPLALIMGKTLIRRVWERCVVAASEDEVYIATDDERIAEHCRQNKMQYLMTGSQCLTGTDRVYEASLQLDADILINVQGDEPLLNPTDITAVIEAARKNPDKIINAMCPITQEEDFRSTSVPKVVATPEGKLLYMSRAAIPTNKKLGFDKATKQVCIYSFPKNLLKRFASLSQKTPLEQIEDIEILRFLELGIDVSMIEVSSASIAVDYPEDIQRVENALNKRLT